MELTLVAIALGCASMCASLVAVFFCSRIWSTRWKNQAPTAFAKRLNTLENEVIELRDKVSALDKAAKRAYGREANARRRTRENDIDSLPDDEWKKEMEKRHALGGFKP